MRGLWILIVALCMTGCGQRPVDTIVEDGECCGLRIGQSVDEVLAALTSRGVHDISIDVDRPIYVTSSSANKLVELSSAVGICVTDHSGVSLNLSFDEHDELKAIWLSPAAQGMGFGLTEGMERERVFVVLADELRRNQKLAVSNCIPGARNVKLAQITQEDADYLRGFAAWTYHEPKGYSHARLTFSDGRLTRIEYHERPFEE